MNKDCLFCKLSQDKKNKIWENDLFYSIFDGHPASPGHSLIIPKRHIVDLEELNDEDWIALSKSIKEIILLIEKTNLKKIYMEMSKDPTSNMALWFINKAINHPRINTKPDAYNHGVNDGRAAGRTVDHLHWHIIPRYSGDMEDPLGGIRYVIPEMGNNKISR